MTDAPAIVWSPAQHAALERVRAWLADPFAAGSTREPGVFRLFGHAGSGKSTLARELASSVSGTVRYAAFTGKAALVMHKKGCLGASTIHRLIYLPRQKCQQRLRELAEKLRAETDADRRRELQLEHDEERKNLARPSWTLNTLSPLRDAALLVIDECFPPGTLVDTPAGPCPIEDVRAGSRILNAIGRDTVIATKRKEVTRVVRIQANGAPAIEASESHPFFTSRGLVRAADLEPGDQILRTTAAVRLLRGDADEPTLDAASSILQRELRRALVGPAAVQGSSLFGQDASSVRRREESLACGRQPEGPEGTRAHTKAEPRIRPSDVCENLSSTARQEAPAAGAGRERSGAHSDRGRAGRRPAQHASGRDRPSRESRKRVSDALQARPGRSTGDALHRAGRRVALLSLAAGAGPQERGETSFARVDRVEILEQGDPRLDSIRDADGKLYFYDLQAERHSSFSVSGLLVHNCSMVGARMGEDLLTFKVPILALGDPAQLPPVQDRGYFTDPRQQPDLLLTEVHRQAEGSPVLRLAGLARHGTALEYGEFAAPGHETSRVVGKKDVPMSSAARDFDQIIVGRNRTRRQVNTRIRAELGYPVEPFPVAGDRLLCKRNDHEVGLLNGSQWTCLGAERLDADRAVLSIVDDDGQALQVESHLQYFRGEEPPHYEIREAQCFDWAYAITCHSAQGSQWRSVCVVDEGDAFGAEAKRWRYTAITRASERVTVVR